MQSALLRKLATIADLSEADQLALSGLEQHVRTVSARRDIISEGDPPKWIHLIVEGWAARYKVVENGARQITAVLLPGDFCDLHVTVLDAMDHSMLAVTNVKVACVRPAAIQAVTGQSVTIAQAFWWLTLLDEAILRSWLVNVGRRSGEVRIAHLICELHVRMARLGPLPDDIFRLPLTQEQLADAVGLTPVHTNRMLKLLSGLGLIDRRGQQMEVRDLKGLRAIAGFDENYLHTPRTRMLNL